MKLVIQRVQKAQVTVGEEIVGKIGPGLFVLVGICVGDDETTMKTCAEKVAKMRIFNDEEGKMNRSVMDENAEIIVVSQFTLYADTQKGNRPSFIEAARPEQAEPLYEYFVQELRNKGIKVETGIFGAHMRIETVLDGPVTIIHS